MSIFSLAAEPQNKEITRSSKSVQIRKSVYFSVIKKVNGYNSCLMVPNVLPFPFLNTQFSLRDILKAEAQLELKILF